MVSEEYKTAYAEVLEILQKIPYIDYLKIPSDKLRIFETYADNKNNFKYNPSLTLDEQHVSKKAKYIIAILYRDYWASPEERKEILHQQQICWQKDEDEKRKQYNADNLFSLPKAISSSNTKTSANTSLTVPSSHDTWVKKVIFKIKKLFHKK